MQFGRVKFFNREKGFGFIICDNGDKDIFVHTSGVAPGEVLTEGVKVSFDTEPSDRGLRAINVKPV